MYFKKHSAACDGPDPLWMEQPDKRVEVESKLPRKLHARLMGPNATSNDAPSSNISGIGVREEDGRSNRGVVTSGSTENQIDALPLGDKLGSVTPEEAQKSLDQLDTLEKSKPTLGRVSRYAALGAVAGPAISAGKSLIQGKSYFKDAVGVLPKLRHIAGESTASAASLGLVPVVRSVMDQSAEKAKLRKYLKENAPTPRVEPPAKVAGVGSALMGAGKKGLQFLEKHEDPIEVGGLAYLAAPNVDNMQAKWRARRTGLVNQDGHPTEHGIEQKRLIKERFHDPMEATGLGALAAPLAAGRLLHGKWGGHA